MIELYIAGQQADLDGVPSLAMTKQFDDLSNPTAIKNAVSKTVALPATPRNNIIFGNIWRIDGQNSTFDPLVRTPYMLISNGAIVMSGYLKLNTINWTLDFPKTYNCTLYGQLGGILYDLSERDFANTQMPLSNYSHTINQTAVARGIGVSEDNMLRYAMSYQGKYDGFDSAAIADPTVSGEASISDLDKEYDENQLNEFRSYYQRPTIPVQAAIQAITAGLRFQQSEEFSGSPYYKRARLVLPAPYRDGSGENPHVGYFSTNPLVSAQTSDGAGQKISYPEWSSSSDSRYSTGGSVDVSGISDNNYLFVSFDVSIIGALIGSGFSNKTKLKGASASPLTITMRARNGGVDGNLIYEKRILYVNDARKIWFNTPAYYNYGRIAWPDNQSGLPVKVEANIPTSGASRITIEFVITLSDQLLWRVSGGAFDGNVRSGAIRLTADLTSAYVRISEQTATRSGSSVNFSSLCPAGHTQLDFLKNITKTFGLIWSVNDKLPDADTTTPRVSWLTRNEFFKDYKTFDWTRKIDFLKDVTTAPILVSSRYSTLAWGESESFRAKDYFATFGQNYGSLKIDTGFMFDGADKHFIDDQIFTNTIMSSEYDAMFNGRTPVSGQDDKVLPAIFNKDGDERVSIDETFQLLFFEQNKTCLPHRITDDSPQMVADGRYCWTTAYGTTQTTYQKFSRVIQDTDSTYWSLDFGKPSALYYPATDVDYPEDSTIYARCWREFLRERFSANTRIMTCYVYLTEDEFYNWKFSDFVRIENTLWHVNKIIDFDPTKQQSTKVELVRVQNLAAYTSGQNWE